MRNKGFTLIELMIVVAIIAIIAAIAIPNLLGARKAANEAAAISNLRTISTACEQYRTSVVPPVYPASLAALTIAGGASTNYIDGVLALGQKSGYDYVLGVGAAAGTTYVCTASPHSTSDGNRAFFLDESGVIRQVAGMGPATVAAAPIQ
ncbi:MAG TPA: prepilin-type N-terminal cleavage/methylation domain-containing protein [Planctomycetota bacterium]|jgi:prepilin-type N-terminal cleavage/methylation domain-containing protein|nr:prepilin-type N-terminal cleavage/methylation domain-containing protein [Planctomycetota bacterium]OQC21610.1 MAG: Type II secretion system protein G precursor [Planctomycetes bacterium ADurb.Bin069]HNR98524.1 prepilin-type N-terminal cleavage/methylation domain-containing protein [Planctomycetota bacterium]HNU26218.1 prepilin-type N-terminal cleavage/methylation domain-containing protein [Planctomycetota bacterium]HOE28748.1 prepilin-type N-terminal cleavage/methylation domain-containing pr